MKLEDRIHLIVVNEYALGYVIPKTDTIGWLRCSTIKGCPYSELQHTTTTITDSMSIRTASEDDFDEFGVYFNGYKNNPEYLHK